MLGVDLDNCNLGGKIRRSNPLLQKQTKPPHLPRALIPPKNNTPTNTLFPNILLIPFLLTKIINSKISPCLGFEYIISSFLHWTNISHSHSLPPHPTSISSTLSTTANLSLFTPSVCIPGELFGGKMSSSSDYAEVSGQKLPARSPEKSSFSQTCSLLRQYLKERGSFGDLTLGMTCNTDATGNHFPRYFPNSVTFSFICLVAQKTKEKL